MIINAINNNRIYVKMNVFNVTAGMILIEMRRLLPLSNAHMIIIVVEWHLNDVVRISFWHEKSKAQQ